MKRIAMLRLIRNILEEHKVKRDNPRSVETGLTKTLFLGFGRLASAFFLLLWFAVNPVISTAQTADSTQLYRDMVLLDSVGHSPEYEAALSIVDSIEQSYLSGNPEWYYEIASEIGGAYVSLQNYNAAATTFYRLENITQELGDSLKLARASYDLGLTYRYLGLDRKALSKLFQSLEILRSHPDKTLSSLVYIQIGIIKKNLGDYDESITYYKDALRLFEIIGNESGVATIYGNLSTVYKRMGEYAIAKEYVFDAIELNKSLGRKKYLSFNYNNLANIYEESDELSKALTYQLKSIEIKKTLPHQPGIALSYSNLSIIYQKQGELTKALDAAREGMAIVKKYKLSNAHYPVSAQLSSVLNQLKKHEEAFDVLNRSVRYKDSIDRSDLVSKMSARETEFISREFKIQAEQFEKKALLAEVKVNERDTLIIGLVLGILILLAVIIAFIISYRKILLAYIRQKKRPGEGFTKLLDEKEQQLKQLKDHIIQIKNDQEELHASIENLVLDPLKVLEAKNRANTKEKSQLYAIQRAINGIRNIRLTRRRHDEQKVKWRSMKSSDILSRIEPSLIYMFDHLDLDLILTNDIEQPSVTVPVAELNLVLFNLTYALLDLTSEGFVGIQAGLNETNELVLTFSYSGTALTPNQLLMVKTGFGVKRAADSELSGLILWVRNASLIIESLRGDIQIGAPSSGTNYITVRIPIPQETQA